MSNPKTLPLRANVCDEPMVPMLNKLKLAANLAANMGSRYLLFRISHELKKKTGLLKKKFPVSPPFRTYLTLQQWKDQPSVFFFRDRESLVLKRQPTDLLKQGFENLRAGKFLMFNSFEMPLGVDYDWVTNPDTGFRYDVRKHWTEIPDLSKEAGDIKYVWEKSRFSFLYDVIRYDYHHGEDCAEFVFAEMLGWIKCNPINCGPNYRCSQEIALRVMNWTFALHYYRNSAALTEAVFAQIQFAIYWQLHHVYHNIHFSRIAVRNNHAITESLMLYLSGILYPSMPGTTKYMEQGKKWLEQEIDYQVYSDGTFLQFSMNYHRVVVQLLTWAIVLADKNGHRFAPMLYDRAEQSVKFLAACMDTASGQLPNYGNNDGALFFKLSEADYRDYRTQLQGLAHALGMTIPSIGVVEEVQWYGLPTRLEKEWKVPDGIHSFPEGGYYLIREKGVLTFIRCGNHRDRPHQADNLHLDIWVNGVNVLLDAGSYKYNTDEATSRYFSGTQSHNTVMLGKTDQMLKGGRFIWYYWTQAKNATVVETDTAYRFEGAISAFRHVGNGIVHRRTVEKARGSNVWSVTDSIDSKPESHPLRQLWHLPQAGTEDVVITAQEGETPLAAQEGTGWESSKYGLKAATREVVFTASGNSIATQIAIKG